MGRFNTNYKNTNRKGVIDENRLRRPEADSDLTGTAYYQNQLVDNAYTSTNAGFHSGSNSEPSTSIASNDPNSQKITYLKAEIDFMVDGFMRQLLDFNAFNNLDQDIQSEIMNRYPQFFK